MKAVGGEKTVRLWRRAVRAVRRRGVQQARDGNSARGDKGKGRGGQCMCVGGVSRSRSRSWPVHPAHSPGASVLRVGWFTVLGIVVS